MPAHRRVRLGIAYTFQITSVFANLSVYDNVALPVQRTLEDGRRKAIVGGGVVRAGVMEVLERSALPAVPQRRPENSPTATSACWKWRWGWR